MPETIFDTLIATLGGKKKAIKVLSEMRAQAAQKTKSAHGMRDIIAQELARMYPDIFIGNPVFESTIRVWFKKLGITFSGNIEHSIHVSPKRLKLHSGKIKKKKSPFVPLFQRPPMR